MNLTICCKLKAKKILFACLFLKVCCCWVFLYFYYNLHLKLVITAENKRKNNFLAVSQKGTQQFDQVLIQSLLIVVEKYHLLPASIFLTQLFLDTSLNNSCLHKTFTVKSFKNMWSSVSNKSPYYRVLCIGLLDVRPWFEPQFRHFQQNEIWKKKTTSTQQITTSR